MIAANLTGETIAGAKVLRLARREAHGLVLWTCLLACGHEETRSTSSLRFSERSGATARCKACRANHGSRRTHGESARRRGENRCSKEFRTWKSMRQRCNNPKSRAYKYYGGRGIKVSPEWNASFEAFLRDLGRAPSAKHTLERKDNEKGYEPRNCIWATRKQQARNTRCTRMITAYGETLALTEWAERSGIHVNTLRHRIFKRGLAPEAALAHGQMSAAVSRIAGGES